jgi:hypothetical protein
MTKLMYSLPAFEKLYRHIMQGFQRPHTSLLIITNTNENSLLASCCEKKEMGLSKLNTGEKKKAQGFGVSLKPCYAFQPCYKYIPITYVPSDMTLFST